MGLLRVDGGLYVKYVSLKVPARLCVCVCVNTFIMRYVARHLYISFTELRIIYGKHAFTIRFVKDDNFISTSFVV